jgi:hypothetical protein
VETSAQSAVSPRFSGNLELQDGAHAKMFLESRTLFSVHQRSPFLWMAVFGMVVLSMDEFQRPTPDFGVEK